MRVLSGPRAALPREIQEQSIDHRRRGVLRESGPAGRALRAGCRRSVHAADQVSAETGETGLLRGPEGVRRGRLGHTDPRTRAEGVHRERGVRRRVVGRLSGREGRRENAEGQQRGGAEVSGGGKSHDLADPRQSREVARSCFQ